LDLAAATASASLARAARSGAAVAVFANLMTMTSYRMGAACVLVCAAGIGVYQMNRARIDARREAATLADTAQRQAREIAALREENRRLGNAVANGAAAASSRGVASSRFNPDEIRQQILGAFRATSLPEAFMQLATEPSCRRQFQLAGVARPTWLTPALPLRRLDPFASLGPPHPGQRPRSSFRRQLGKQLTHLPNAIRLHLIKTTRWW
jgi:hypothetical protein